MGSEGEPPVSLLTEGIHHWIDDLANVKTEGAGRGVTREVYTPEYGVAAEYISSLMREANLETREDSVGNLFGKWTGSEPDLPRLLTGSHFDTTLDAGRLDGVFGVVGAIEAVRRLKEKGLTPRRTIEVVGIAGEEPRFGIGCIGSRAMIGALSRSELDTLVDRTGISVAAAMRASGFDPDKLHECRIAPGELVGFVELHIEQGAVLEQAGVSIGVVERIAAPHDVRVTLTGVAQHAGSTPMTFRRDALAGAAQIVLAVEELARTSRSRTTVGTVGVLRVEPGAINVIPGSTVLEIDIRDSDLAARSEVVDAVINRSKAIANSRNLQIAIETLAHDVPATCSPTIVSAARSACEDLGEPYVGMTSGAYHDAMVLGAIAPMGMIFVPSIGGISHHPDEDTDERSLEVGVEVLAGTLERLAR